ncbi:hypothetical protein AB0L06_34325 [Spirillospora sp. NPDC052269]
MNQEARDSFTESTEARSPGQIRAAHALTGDQHEAGEDGGRRRTFALRRPSKEGLLLGVVVVTGVTALSQFTGIFRDAPPYYGAEPVEYRKGDAARLLLAAADAMPDSHGPGRLWYQRSLLGETVVVRSSARPGVRYAVRVEQDDHVLASAGDPLPARDAQGRRAGEKYQARSLRWQGDRVTVRPVGAADEAEWEADGRPGSRDLRAREPDRSSGPGTKGGESGLDLDADEAAGLPADPAKLRAALLNHAVQADHRRVPNPDEYLYRSASFLLVDVPIDDDVRAATYRLLAGLRGVRFVTATDATGRPRQGVALRMTTPDHGTIDSELLIDPSAGRLVVGQEVVVPPGTRDAGLRPGDRWRYKIVRQAGWTNRPAQGRPRHQGASPGERDES